MSSTEHEINPADVSFAHPKTTLEVATNYVETCYSQYQLSINNKSTVSTSQPPLIVFVSAPQGAGKTYLTTKLRENLSTRGYRCLAVSIDDFYLTHADQAKINNSIGAHNPLVNGRGLPLTHDLPLLSQFFQQLFNENEKNNKQYSQRFIQVPRYDKSKFNGEGDRLSELDKIATPLDIVLLEGWFLGFNPIPDESKIHNENMIIVNKELSKYKNTLWNNPLIQKYNNTCGVIVKCESGISIEKLVTKWRLQQEHAMIDKTGNGMTDDQVKNFVSRYLPSYELYYTNLVKMGKMSDLIVEINPARQLVAFKIRDEKAE
ncbi:hypothetical protein ACO0QE_000373 [Hanseniaspora vineae]